VKEYRQAVWITFMSHVKIESASMFWNYSNAMDFINPKREVDFESKMRIEKLGSIPCARNFVELQYAHVTCGARDFKGFFATVKTSFLTVNKRILTLT